MFSSAETDDGEEATELKGSWLVQLRYHQTEKQWSMRPLINLQRLVDEQKENKALPPSTPAFSQLDCHNSSFRLEQLEARFRNRLSACVVTAANAYLESPPTNPPDAAPSEAEVKVQKQSTRHHQDVLGRFVSFCDAVDKSKEVDKKKSEAAKAAKAKGVKKHVVSGVVDGDEESVGSKETFLPGEIVSSYVESVVLETLDDYPEADNKQPLHVAAAAAARRDKADSTAADVRQAQQRANDSIRVAAYAAELVIEIQSLLLYHTAADLRTFNDEAVGGLPLADLRALIGRLIGPVPEAMGSYPTSPSRVIDYLKVCFVMMAL